MLTHTVLSRYYVIRFAQVHEQMNERCAVPYTYRHTEDNQDMFVVDFSDPFHLQEWDGLHKNVLTYLELGKPRTARSVVDQITTYIETIEGEERLFCQFPTSFMKDWEDRRFPETNTGTLSLKRPVAEDSITWTTQTLEIFPT